MLATLKRGSASIDSLMRVSSVGSPTRLPKSYSGMDVARESTPRWRVAGGGWRLFFLHDFLAGSSVSVSAIEQLAGLFWTPISLVGGMVGHFMLSFFSHRHSKIARIGRVGQGTPVSELRKLVFYRVYNSSPLLPDAGISVVVVLTSRFNFNNEGDIILILVRTGCSGWPNGMRFLSSTLTFVKNLDSTREPSSCGGKSESPYPP